VRHRRRQLAVAQTVRNEDVRFGPVEDQRSEARGIPEHRPAHHVAAVHSNALHDLRIAGRLVSESGRVEKVQDPLFAAAEHQIRAGKQRKARAAQVVVVDVQRRFVGGREVVDESQSAGADAELQQRIAEVPRSVPQ